MHLQDLVIVLMMIWRTAGHQVVRETLLLTKVCNQLKQLPDLAILNNGK